MQGRFAGANLLVGKHTKAGNLMKWIVIADRRCEQRRCRLYNTIDKSLKEKFSAAFTGEVSLGAGDVTIAQLFCKRKPFLEKTSLLVLLAGRTDAELKRCS